jgi:hypothetical protein
MRIWKRPLIIAVLFAAGVVALAGCTQREAPGFDPNSGTAKFSEAISPYTLVFISRSYDSESNQTTFLYQLQNTNAPEPGPATGVLGVFTNVLVEVPACAGTLNSFSPPDGGTVGTNVSGIYGVEWGVGYDVNPDFDYSVTFAGDVPAGNVRGQVTRGGQRYVQNLAGPCEGDYSVSGSVFTDANQDGVQQPTELGISDVTVTLTGSETSQTALTDSDGNYVFTAGSGTYTVSVDSATVAADYNESLYQDWEATNSQSRVVTIGPDSAGNNFGWEPDVAHIIALVDAGDITTNGKSYKWWRKELLRTIQGNANTAYTQAQMLGFIHQIEALALTDEYDFTPGHELQEAYDILNNHFFGDDDDGNSINTRPNQGIHDAYAFLLRELLTFEFNHVSGRGFDDVQLRAILINWGEGLLKDNTPASEGYIIGEPGDFPRLLTSPLEDGGTIFKKGNGATGGGGTGG